MGLQALDVSTLKQFLLAFIPLLVAMEPLGVLPVYLSLTSGMDDGARRAVLFYSIITATLITLAFLVVGKAVFIALGITIYDFQIAGGLVLLFIAMSDIVQSARVLAAPKPTSGIGIVPLGTPLIAGPAALTTILMLQDLYGFAITLAALFTNLALVWLAFIFSGRIIRVIGENGARGLSKVISLLLAAIAVMMIRKGLERLFM